jgi:hypothetical protein
MKKVSLLVILFLALGLFLGASGTASAQDDPPSRVARLNFIEGSVSYQSSDDAQDWVAADPNRPLTTGDNLWSDDNSRGELHVGGTSIRLSSQTGISILNLDDQTLQIQLAQGTIEVRVRDFDPDTAYEIDTPNLAYTITGPGAYRIETSPDGNWTKVTVRAGQGQVTGGGQSYLLNAGQSYSFSGTDQLSYDAEGIPSPDGFEMWSETRDQREDASPSARYVSRDMNGYADLDNNGDWRQDPEYGPVWVPRGVAVGWAPYHDGHWVFVAPWGWTWVDSQPWGFAPFHYGRWAIVGGTWGWVPGPPAVRPVYAPALVAFVGGGPGGFGVSVGFGGGFAGVAWFPLGPRDVYLPSYQVSQAYVTRINVTNTRVVNVAQVTNVYNTYHNTTVVNNVTINNRVTYTYANNAAAVTAVSRETFVGARPVAAASVRVTADQLKTVHVVEAAPLTPTRASYVSASARVTPTSAQPKVAFAQRPIVARIAPPAPPARPGVAPRVAPRVVSSGVAPKGGRPEAHTTGTVTPKSNQPAARPDAVVQPAPRANAAPPAKTNEPARTNPPVNNQPARANDENRENRPAPEQKPKPAPQPERKEATPPKPPPPSKDKSKDEKKPKNEKPKNQPDSRS